jgi:hypothetical protein
VAPRVFINYSHDSEARIARVLSSHRGSHSHDRVSGKAGAIHPPPFAPAFAPKSHPDSKMSTLPKLALRPPVETRTYP